MFAVIGLGNPGQRYVETRHNAGFRAVEQLVKSSSAASWEHKFGCCWTKTHAGGAPCLVILPQKYMNLSGEAAVPLLRYFQIGADELIVVHDDLDLDVGKVRLRRGGSPAGHRGLVDLIRHLGSGDFFRVRIGIGHPRREQTFQAPQLDDEAVTRWVLGVPPQPERDALEEAVCLAAEAIPVLITEGLETAQRRFHGSGKQNAPSDAAAPGSDKEEESGRR